MKDKDKDIEKEVREIHDFLQKSEYDMNCLKCPIAESELTNCLGTDCHYHLLKHLCLYLLGTDYKN